MDFEPDSFKGKRLEAALKGHDSAMLKIKRAPDIMAQLGQKSRLTAVMKKDVQSEAEKDISEQHEGSILKLASTAVRSSLAKRTPRGTSIEQVAEMSTAKLAAYAGIGVAANSVRSSVAKALPKTLKFGVYSREHSLEHAVCECTPLLPRLSCLPPLSESHPHMRHVPTWSICRLSSHSIFCLTSLHSLTRLAS